MNLLRRKKKDIRVPTGRDAVNFKKVLFLPISETQDLLTNPEWQTLDFRCLTLMKTKMLRASCIARGLQRKGGKRKLVARLTASLTEQMNAEFARREKEHEMFERHQDMLGGVWSFGTGVSGQLGHGDAENYEKPTLIKKLRGFAVTQVFAGFDSDVSFALTRTGDVYVWGKRTGPTGLSNRFKKRLIDDEDDELLLENTPKVQTPVNAKTKSSVSSFAKGFMNAIDPAAGLKELDDQAVETPNDEDDEDDEDEDALEDILEPIKLMSLCGEGVNQIAVGRVHCCAKTKDGDVFTWGHNDHAQLGNEPVHALSAAQSKKARIHYGIDHGEPLLWQRSIPENCVIKQVDVGTNHTFAVSNDGHIYAFGAVFNTCEQSSLTRTLNSLNVAQVSCGSMHAALVTTNGQAYTWGSGDGGRLGHGDTVSYVVPKLVEALKEDVIFEVACGCWHTMAVVLIPPLIKGGLLYTWGTGRLGQLAQGGTQFTTTPGLVTDLLLSHVLIKQVSAGIYHNVVLSVDDEVFTWGSNVNGCLGRPDELNGLEESFCAVPGKIEGFEAFVGRPCSVACGREFTLVATKPYLGPSEEEIAKKEAEAKKIQECIERQEQQVLQEKILMYQELQQDKRLFMIETLNSKFPRCSVCHFGLGCPGFQKDSVNPATCKHCLHDHQQHQETFSANDPRATSELLLQVAAKLEFEWDFSHLRNFDKEEELEAELQELDEATIAQALGQR